MSSGLTSLAGADAAELAADVLALLAAEALAETLALDADALPESEAAEPDAPEAALELDDPPQATSPTQHAHNKPAIISARCFFMMLPSLVFLPCGPLIH